MTSSVSAATTRSDRSWDDDIIDWYRENGVKHLPWWGLEGVPYGLPAFRKASDFIEKVATDPSISLQSLLSLQGQLYHREGDYEADHTNQNGRATGIRTATKTLEALLPLLREKLRHPGRHPITFPSMSKSDRQPSNEMERLHHEWMSRGVFDTKGARWAEENRPLSGLLRAAIQLRHEPGGGSELPKGVRRTLRAGAAFEEGQRRARPMDPEMARLTEAMGRLKILRNVARASARGNPIDGVVMRFNKGPARLRPRVIREPPKAPPPPRAPGASTRRRPVPAKKKPKVKTGSRGPRAPAAKRPRTAAQRRAGRR